MNVKLTNVINKLYGIRVAKSRVVREGFLSRNHVLFSKNDKYFLKQYRFSDKNKIAEIHRVKRLFAENGIPVILPLRNKKHFTYFRFEGNYYALFPFVGGKKLSSRQLSVKALRSAGAMLADMHVINKNKPPIRLENRFEPWNKKEFLVKAKKILIIVERKKSKSSFDRLAIKTLKGKIALAEKNTVRFEDLNLKNDHVTHGDYHENNMFFDDNDTIAWVFDFEKAKLAPRVVEVVRSAVLICFDGKFTPKNFKRAAEYLRAYSKIYPLKQVEVRDGMKAFSFKHLHSLWVETEHYLKHNRRVDKFIKTDLDEYDFVDRNSEKLISLFTDPAGDSISETYS
jgi:Ser/Thr protein kinase RdoA (MazF antagonist)